MWGATPLVHADVLGRLISIHAPRVGSDVRLSEHLAKLLISIHAPRVGSDNFVGISIACTGLFQSTLPVWGATYTFWCGLSNTWDFNPRSPCGERHGPMSMPFWPSRNFNPRSPCGERLLALDHDGLAVEISIHAPRVGSDCTYHSSAATGGNFNPRSPCGERHGHRRIGRRASAYFNPRSPCGERRHLRIWFGWLEFISIHAPRVGSDLPLPCPWRSPPHFNPRSPCGERRPICAGSTSATRFQSTLPVWGATAIYSTIQNQKQYLVN